jgi:hypothetical protein
MFRYSLSKSPGSKSPRRKSPGSKSPGKFILFIMVCATLGGCLADNGPIVQVVPRLVLAPQNPRFQAVNFIPPVSGSILVKWNRSIADTQLNFKGYFVKLWTSDTIGVIQGDPDNLDTLIDSVRINRIGSRIPDTFYTFTQSKLGSSIPIGRYTVVVYGVKANDSGTLSQDSSMYSALFDPRPLLDPTNLRATSLGPTQIGLRWTPSPDDSSSRFFRYVIYYRDTTKNDTGHVIALDQKAATITDTNGVKFGWDDSTAIVNVPGVTPQNGTTTEWPYQFWIKSQRIDSTFFYGSDTNEVVWAGAERVPRNGNDSSAGNQGYLRVKHSMYFGSLNQEPDVAEDSTDNKGQVLVSVNNGQVTLTAQSPNGIGFLSRMDEDSSLDFIYYSAPLDDPSQFTNTSITLPMNASSGGIIVYLMMNDDQVNIGHMWARIFIHAQADGSFVNPYGGIDIKASFQPGVSKDGSKHLPYY